MAARVRVTAEDLWCMPRGDLRRELVNGEIIEVTPVGLTHGELTVRIALRLADHVKAHGGGKVVAGDVGFVLNLSHDPERVRGADIAFISTPRLPKNPEKYMQGAPDLAVEILSPSDSSVEILQKVHDYLEAGARLVWVIAPQAKTATVYRADGSAALLKESDALEGEDVLPGLTIPLAEVFED